MTVYSIIKITNSKIKIGKVFSSIKQDLSSYHVQSTALGKVTETQILTVSRPSSNGQPTLLLANISKQGFKTHCAYFGISRSRKICTLQSPFWNMKASWLIHFVSTQTE